MQAAPASRTLTADRDSWYAIRWQSHLIGYSRFQVQESVELGGDAFYVISSDSRIKLGPDAGSEAAFSGRLLVNRASLLPSLFVCSQRQGALDLRVECLFTPHLVAQKNGNGNQEIASTAAIEAPAHLLFNNVWGRVDTFIEHYALLLSVWQERGEKDGILVYDPVLRATETLSFTPEGTTTVAVPGRGDVSARVIAISDKRGPLARAAVATSNGRLLRLEELRGGFQFTLSDARVEALVKRTAGVDLNRGKLDLSNVYFPKAQSLRTVRATVDVHTAGRPVLTRSVLGFQQTFEGAGEETGAKGTVEVQTSEVTVKSSTPYPRRPPYTGDLAAFTQPEYGIESRDAEMRSKGEEVAWRSRTSWEAARKINTWVHDKVADGYSMPSARYVLQAMSGNSESKSLLAVTLLRSLNIPARRISGLIFQQGYFVPHTWAEVWVGDEGWAIIDPTTGETGLVGASHIALGDVTEVSSLDVNVESYRPLLPARVPFFTRELTWPVGQRRVYSVVHSGKQIGTETAQVVGLKNIDGKDVYEMTFAVDKTLDGKRTAATSTLHTSPEVLPRRYVTASTSDTHTRQVTFEFLTGAVRQDVKLGSETRMQETPVSEGVYLFDPRFLSMYALIVGQLPNPSLGTKASVFVYDPSTHETREMPLQIRQEEKVGVAGEEKETWRCESTDGVSFFIEKTSGQVLRIESPRDDMVLQLVESAIKI